MTIQAFARLCGCNPQTLRYYDKVDLMKPCRVDRFSGYRYYDEEQALTFVKIKNLQTAGFTIEEIRSLLDAGDETVYQAFETKISEQEAKLQTMKKIQRSYRSEMTTMIQTIEKIRKSMETFDPAAEFGIDRSVYDTICAQIDEYLARAVDSDGFRDFEFEEETDSPDAMPKILDDPAYKRVYEKHGWQYIKDFFPEFAELADGGEYQLVFLLTEDKPNHIAFANTVLNLLLRENEGKKRTLGCSATPSTDGENHFWLLKKKS